MARSERTVYKSGAELGGERIINENGKTGVDK
jgi:hypothetical protein